MGNHFGENFPALPKLPTSVGCFHNKLSKNFDTTCKNVFLLNFTLKCVLVIIPSFLQHGMNHGVTQYKINV